MDSKKKTIFLIGDSTVQSYGLEKEPQAGWGQLLMRHFCKNGSYSIMHPDNTGFEQVVRYESENLIIDNRAMAGRSAKSFFDEGRTADALLAMSDGDIMLIQFAHNDANKEKPERYLTTEDYKKMLLEKYIEPARKKGVTPVLGSAIAMREFDDEGNCKISFPEYRNAMMELSALEKIAFIDLGDLTARYNTKIGIEGCKNIYLWLPAGAFDSFYEGSTDDAHLQYNGAFAYAKIVYDELLRQKIV